MRDHGLPPGERLTQATEADRERLDAFVGFSGCAAPFTQMLIAWGLVSSCCYQDRIALGDLRQARLPEIWNGANFAALRGKMLAQVPFGKVDARWPLEAERGASVCEYCAGFAGVAGWTPNLARSAAPYNLTYNERMPPCTTKLDHLPSYLEFKYTMLCNLECPMCYDWWKPRPLRYAAPGIPVSQLSSVYDEHYWEDLKPFLAAAGTLCFLGGEPLLQQEVWKTIDLHEAAGSAAEVQFVTNLTAWSQPVEARLARIRRLVVTISLESCNPATYEFFRFPARFDHFERCLERLNCWRLRQFYEQGNVVTLTAILTATALNLEELVPTLVWLKQRSIGTVHVDVAFQPGWRLPDRLADPLPSPPGPDAVPISPAVLPAGRRRAAIRTIRRQLDEVAGRSVTDTLGFRRPILDEASRASIQSALARIDSLDATRSPAAALTQAVP